MKMMTGQDKRALTITFSFLTSAIFLLLFGFNVNPFRISCAGDSSIYQQMGLAVLQGEKVPYLDVFDHKGFLLYCIQAIGLWIDKGHWGLFLLSVISLGFCIYYWLKTAQLLLTRMTAWFPIFLTLLIYALLLDKGNDTEFWSLPFISYTNYLIAKYYVKNINITYIECFFMGIGMGGIIWIRLNNMAPICITCLFMFIVLLKKQEYKRLVLSICSVLSGIVLVCVFTILLFTVLYGYNNISHLLFGTFGFNFQYAAGHGNGTLLQFPFYISILVLSVAFLLIRKKRLIAMIYVASAFLFTYLTFGKAYYLHYFSITIPLYLLLFVLFFDSHIYRNLRNKKIILFGLCCMMIIGGVMVLPSLKLRIERGKIYEKGFRNLAIRFSKIPQIELDSVWNYNAGIDGASIMQSLGHVQMNRIFLQMQLDVTDQLKEIGTIEDLHPLWIMVREQDGWNRTVSDSVYLEENYNRLITTDMSTDMYSNISFYRRKF